MNDSCSTKHFVLSKIVPFPAIFRSDSLSGVVRWLVANRGDLAE